MYKERPWGPAVQTKIAGLLGNIALHGLGEKNHSEIIENHLTPENFNVTNPSKLNKEIINILPEPSIKRDLRTITTQRTIYGCFSAASRTLNCEI